MNRNVFFLNRFLKKFIFFTLVVCLLSWVLKPVELKNGIWRATIKREDGNEIVFNFLSKDSAGKKIIYILNGNEHLLVDSIETKDDSVFIELPFFESGFKARITSDGNLEGQWIKHYGERILRLPFKAKFNEPERFKVSSPPIADISGKWLTTFHRENKKTVQYVAEFKQKGSHLSGTVLDPTGDFRFLDGVVTGDSLKLSTFDGANAYVLIAKIDNKNRISGGKFYAGATGTEDWTAVRKENANPESGFIEPKINPDGGPVNFTFRDSKTGEPVSFEKYKGKVVVLDILGSWCPNCMDETKFLSDYYLKNRNKGFEVIGLAYERTTDFKSSQEALLPFEKRLNVQYPILITGVTSADTLITQKTLPQLEKIKAFPTIVFVDKKGNMRKVESGFSGPATGEYYTEFKKEFNRIVNQLLDEK
ncbi:MAG TPA: TlpA disulfide reductase family protein [Hanamia sp.]|nr:TlpA disulfide reductase family protein [Hanamia sp.]